VSILAKVLISFLWGTGLLFIGIGAWRDRHITPKQQVSPALVFMAATYIYTTYMLWVDY